MWPHIILFVVTTVLSYLMQPKPAKPKPTSLEDLNIPTADEDKEIPVLFGTREIKDSNIVWYGDLYTKAIKSKGGKK